MQDNIGLLHACAESELVIPCFIFNPRVTEKNHRTSAARIRFMMDCLRDLDGELRKIKSRLHIFYGDYAAVVESINQTRRIDAVFINQDYTPFAKKRQEAISGFCRKANVPFLRYIDHFLYDPNMVKTLGGKPYTVFSQFFRTAFRFVVSKPRKNRFRNFDPLLFDLELDVKLQDGGKPRDKSVFRGGRRAGLQALSCIVDHALYKHEREYPSRGRTTMLSAHNRFGTISIREVYGTIEDVLGRHHALMAQIHWREFFNYILYHFPHVIRGPFKKKYLHVRFGNNQRYFDSWKNGVTGFPIIDAGMRQLNTTGFMHNRVRMITSSFLVKDLHLDWRLGEKYFAEKLVDYDPAVNNGNWQWAASVGCDAQPWFRIFNPWLQQKRFDADCKYILRWIPELEKLKPDQIHNLFRVRPGFDLRYPAPIVDHEVESRISRQNFKTCVIADRMKE